MSSVYLFIILLFVISCPAYRAENSIENLTGPFNYIVFGNSGSGKSTFLNSLVGRIAFESGISTEGAKTKTVQIVSDGSGNKYIDTPGLTDPKKRYQASQEIKKGLTQEGKYKIFFIITLEEGRVRPDDLATIRLVLDSIPVKKDEYSIIINKLAPILKDHLGLPDTYTKFLEILNEGLPGTSRVFLKTHSTKLFGESNILQELKADLRAFIEESPAVEIDPKKVKEISHNLYEKVVHKVKAGVEKWRKIYNILVGREM